MTSSHGADDQMLVGRVVDPLALDASAEEPFAGLSAAALPCVDPRALDEVASVAEHEGESRDVVETANAFMPRFGEEPGSEGARGGHEVDADPPGSQTHSAVGRDPAVSGEARDSAEGSVASDSPRSPSPQERFSEPSLTPLDLGIEASGPFDPSLRLARGRAMRERLMARAAVFEGAAHDGLTEFESPDEDAGALPRDRELGLVCAPAYRPPAAPTLASRRRREVTLSANVIALFGTLLGMAVVATIVALLIRLAPEPQAIDWAPLVRPRLMEATEAQPSPPTAKVTPKEEPPVKKRERKRMPGPWRVRDAQGDSGARIVKGTIGRDPFLKAVEKAGLPTREAYRALTALKGLRDFDNCGRNDQFMAVLDRSSRRLKAFEYIVTPEEVYQAREQADGLLKGAKLDLKVQRQRFEGAFVFRGGNVDDSAERGGLERGLAGALATALQGHMTLSELEPGDRLKIIGQEVTVLGEFARYAGIEAVELRRVAPDSQPFAVYYFRGSKSRGHYDNTGKAPYEGGWRKPIPGAPVTSKFNPKRMHPVLHKVMPHNGTDFGAPMGEPVYASSPGVVTVAGYVGATGNLVKIEHAGGYETGYAHLSRFAEGLRVGDKVKRLQVIGYVGSTGRSTGPHLHFSAKKDGKFIDAESLNLDGMRTLPADEREEFSAAQKQYDEMLAKIPLPDVPSSLVAVAKAEPKSGPAPAGDGDEAGSSAEAPGMGEEGDEDLGSSAAPATLPPSGAPRPSADPASASGSSVYLTDEELNAFASGT